MPSSGGVPVAASQGRPLWQLPPGFLQTALNAQPPQQPPASSGAAAAMLPGVPGSSGRPNLATFPGLQGLAGAFCLVQPQPSSYLRILLVHVEQWSAAVTPASGTLSAAVQAS